MPPDSTASVIGTTITVILAILLVLTVVDTGPVSRDRLERFAQRHSLTVTARNGNHIIAYLATTRRWRSAGVVVGLAVHSIGQLGEGRIGVAFLPLFAGWFAGALAAEARQTYRHHGSLRRASLVPRDPSRYLWIVHRLLVPTATMVSVAVGVVTLIQAANGREVAAGQAVLALFTGLMIAAAVQLTQRRALNRPQPVAEPDVVAADDAIRSRSMHVLASAGATLVFFCVYYQLEALLGAPNYPMLVGTLVAPLVGWLLGISHWPVSQPDETSTVPAT